MDHADHVSQAMLRLLGSAGASADSVWTSLPGGRLHHLEAGAGRPIVLLHGGTGGGANWFRQIGPLSRHHRVLAPDLPGFGLSDAVAPAAPLGRSAADILLRWMEVHDVGDAAVVGTSFGGLTAVRLAQAASNARVSRLLLLDSAGLGRRIHATVRLAAATPLTASAVRPSRRGTRLQLRWLLTRRPDRLTPEQQDALVEFLYAVGTRAGTWYLVRTLRLFVGARGQCEVLAPAELATLSLPVTVMWGARDRLLPLAHGRRAAALIPDADLVTVPGAGHSPNWESPAEVTAAIEQLVQRRARPS